MSRQAQAFQWSLAIHLIMTLTVILGGGALSPPIQINLSDFSLVSAPEVEIVHSLPDKSPQSFKEAEQLPKAIHSPAKTASAVDRPPPREITTSKTKIKPLSTDAMPDVPHSSPMPADLQQMSRDEVAEAETQPSNSTETSVVHHSASQETSQLKKTKSAHTGEETMSGNFPRSLPNIAEKRKQYLAQHFTYIRDRIMKNLSYPAIARKKGWAGQVKLSFRINRDGSVADVTVVSGSGFAVLDRHAIDTVNEVAPFPIPPEHAEITIPITYALRK